MSFFTYIINMELQSCLCFFNTRKKGYLLYYNKACYFLFDIFVWLSLTNKFWVNEIRFCIENINNWIQVVQTTLFVYRNTFEIW